MARSFSGDKRQLQAILKAAIAHKGLSVIDVISPCVTFNDHEGSTKSYSYMKDHEEPLHELDFVPFFEDISVEIPEGEVQDVRMHDGSRLRIRKLGRDYDPTSKLSALPPWKKPRPRAKCSPGFCTSTPRSGPSSKTLNMVDAPLATLPESKVRPSRRGPGRGDGRAAVRSAARAHGRASGPSTYP